jgi:hypothetical protein
MRVEEDMRREDDDQMDMWNDIEERKKRVTRLGID